MSSETYIKSLGRINGGEEISSITVGDTLYHPCSIDIIEFTVTAVITTEHGVSFQAKSKHDVGACRKVEVLLSSDKFGKLFYSDLLTDCEYEDGLWDFVEGRYFLSKELARMHFYKIQRELINQKVDHFKRMYEQAKYDLERVDKILQECMEVENEK